MNIRQLSKTDKCRIIGLGGLLIGALVLFLRKSHMAHTLAYLFVFAILCVDLFVILLKNGVRKSWFNIISKPC